ncbi:uncharacterized protein N7477_010190 [Penicillium maclennaniae]|uniref:uncharacterized protein n=1 Tax=Penicillium maclennaniae TaxID=1343394 RepID=UPI0025405994|nr:uncharacterized protein N7477_010190 [Penicillium maclennaniae]KAJ5662574.1 hypothetical protein N7477_010190 [Penicillium maclennaniae]
MSDQIQQCFQLPGTTTPNSLLPEVPPPGSCAMRLQGLENMSKLQKTELVDSISTDIRALILCLREHINAGNIDIQHTRSFDILINLIQQTDLTHQRMLVRKVRRLRKERHRVRKDLRQFYRNVDELARKQMSQVRKLKERLQDSRKKMAILLRELDFLRLSRGNQDNEDQKIKAKTDKLEGHLSPEELRIFNRQELSIDTEGGHEEEIVKQK